MYYMRSDRITEVKRGHVVVRHETLDYCNMVMQRQKVVLMKRIVEATMTMTLKKFLDGTEEAT